MSVPFLLGSHGVDGVAPSGIDFRRGNEWGGFAAGMGRHGLRLVEPTTPVGFRGALPCRGLGGRVGLDGHADHFFDGGGGEFAVHAADEGGGDAGGADGFAGVII